MIRLAGVRVYQDLDDFWIGYYRGEHRHFVCLFPTLVISWDRKIQDPVETGEGAIARLFPELKNVTDDEVDQALDEERHK